MRPSILLTLVTLPLLLGAGGSLSRPHPVLLARSRTEPAVAVDPANPSLIVASGNTNYNAPVNQTYPVPFFTSHNGGKSFSSGLLPLPAPYTTAADTSVAIARDQTVFYSYLAETAGYCWNSGGAILLAHSIDHGLSFRGPTLVDSNPADDRPTVAVESISGHLSHVFEAWTRSYSGHSEIWFARSTNGGASFDPPTMLYSSRLTNFGAAPVVGPHQHIYVFWLTRANAASTAAASAQVLLTASTDDGSRFGPVRGAGSNFTDLPQLGMPGGMRDLSVATAAASPAGRLYVAYAAGSHRNNDGSVDANIDLTRSEDHGRTWSRPRPVNDTGQGDRFMPALTVLKDGSIGVAFYDRRGGPGELDVYAARASFRHGFHAARNVRVNTVQAPVDDILYYNQGHTCFPSGRFFGDYIGVAADGDSLAVAWADSQPNLANETDLWFTKVNFPNPVTHRTSTALPSSLSGHQAGSGSVRSSDISRTLGQIRHLSTAWLIFGLLVLLFPVLSLGIVFRSYRHLAEHRS